MIIRGAPQNYQRRESYGLCEEQLMITQGLPNKRRREREREEEESLESTRGLPEVCPRMKRRESRSTWGLPEVYLIKRMKKLRDTRGLPRWQLKIPRFTREAPRITKEKCEEHQGTTSKTQGMEYPFLPNILYKKYKTCLRIWYNVKKIKEKWLSDYNCPSHIRDPVIITLTSSIYIVLDGIFMCIILG